MHAEHGSEDSCLSAAEAYSRIAADYEALVAGDAWMRRVLHAHYLRVFAAGDRILDLGCGTGIDAIFLAQHGVRVLGIDAAAGMIERARERARVCGVESMIEVRVFDASELSTLGVRVDGAISAFAALNTVSDLAHLAMALRTVVRPGGRVIVHMLNRFSTWEYLGYVANFNWPAARETGRSSDREFTIGGQRVVHRMYRAADVAQVFGAAGFRLCRAYGLGALRPPHTVRRIPGPIVNGLEWLDVRLGGLPRLRDGGRFFVLDLEAGARPG